MTYRSKPRSPARTSADIVLPVPGVAGEQGRDRRGRRRRPRPSPTPRAPGRGGARGRPARGAGPRRSAGSTRSVPADGRLDPARQALEARRRSGRGRRRRCRRRSSGARQRRPAAPPAPRASICSGASRNASVATAGSMSDGAVAVERSRHSSWRSAMVATGASSEQRRLSRPGRVPRRPPMRITGARQLGERPHGGGAALGQRLDRAGDEPRAAQPGLA